MWQAHDIDSIVLTVHRADRKKIVSSKCKQLKLAMENSGTWNDFQSQCHVPYTKMWWKCGENAV